VEQARFQAVIQAVDKASGPLRAIRAQVVALRQPLSALEGGFRRAGAQLQDLARVSGLHRIAGAARDARGAFENLSAKVSGVLTPLGLLGGAGSVAGLLGIVKGAAEAGSGLNDLYNRLGAVTEAQQAMVAGFRYSATQEGAQAEDAAAGLTRLNRVVAEARAGKNPEAMDLFRQAKVRLTGPKGQKLTGLDILPQVAQLLEKNEDPGLRERIAKALMGKGGGELINALVAYQENAKRLKTFGRVFSREDVSALDDFGDRWDDLNMAILGVRNAIGARLAPILTPLLQDLAHWVAANRELIAGKVKAWVDDIAAAIGKWNLQETVADLRGLLAGVRTVVSALGGWKGVMIGFTALLAGPWIAAIGGVVTALAGLGVAFLANPIAGAGLAAVGAAAYGIVRNWQPIKAFFVDLWRGIADTFSAAWAIIQGFPMAALAAGVMRPWDAVKAFFVDLWRGIADTFSAAWAIIQGFPMAALAAGVMRPWDAVKAFFTDLWAGIAQAFTSAWAGIRAGVVDPLIAAAQRIAAAWQALGPIIERFRAMEGSGPRLPGEAVPRRGGLNGAGRLEAFPGIEPRPMRFTPGGAGRDGGQVTVRFVNAPRELRVDTPRTGTQPVRVAVGYAFGKGSVFA